MPPARTTTSHYLRDALPAQVTVTEITDRALVALQGPMAEAAFARLAPSVAGMRFMDVAVVDWQGTELWVSRSGYTGEDGFEISVPATQAEALAQALLDMDRGRARGPGRARFAAAGGGPVPVWP
jgi:aminomethyltransferase